MTLTKLNVVKRDTRTIDEIVQDRAKAKTLDGDKAREFSDWFGTSKKKDKTSPLAPASSYSSSTSSITMSTFLSGSQSTTSAVTSGTNTPVSSEEHRAWVACLRLCLQRRRQLTRSSRLL